MLDCIVVGDIMIDVILKSDRGIVNELEANGTNYFQSSRIVPGGAGNVAAALSHLGAKVAIIGKAGNDIYARAFVEDAESRGISSSIVFDKATSTGFTVSLVENEGHRTMLVSRGANDSLTPEEVRTQFDLLEPTKFVYLSGYSLLNSPQREALLEAGRIGRMGGSKVVFDPGSSNLIKSSMGAFERAIVSCDVLCANLAESRLLANLLDVSEYMKIVSQGGKQVIVKLGPEGCLVSKGGEVSKVPGWVASPVDTTGAGDAFLGALLYCLSQGRDLTRSAMFANWFAARKVEGLGPRHFPNKHEIEAVLHHTFEEIVINEQQSHI